MIKIIKANDLLIRYTVKDSDNITTIILTLKELEDGDLYAKLHNSENYTCLAKILKREVIMEEEKKDD
jgi:hypothetical protein